MANTFPHWQIEGHNWAVESLARDVTHAQVGNAYLLSGPHGIGKRTLALTFIRALFCTAPQKPCGQCRACRLVLGASHPDLIRIDPVIGGTLIKSARIGIEQIRDLSYQLSLRPVEAPRRVALITQFESANDSAANALLKTLEEPPGNALFVLTASDEEALLATILSRCERLSLRPLPIPQVENALQSRWHIPVEQAQLLAHQSGGRLGWAVRASQQAELLENHQKGLTELHQLLQQGMAQRFLFAEQASKDREGLLQLLESWQIAWRDVLLLASDQPERITNLAQQSWLAQTAQTLGAVTAVQVLEKIAGVLQLLERNINARLALEVLLLEMPRLHSTSQ